MILLIDSLNYLSGELEELNLSYMSLNGEDNLQETAKYFERKRNETLQQPFTMSNQKVKDIKTSKSQSTSILQWIDISNKHLCYLTSCLVELLQKCHQLKYINLGGNKNL